MSIFLQLGCSATDTTIRLSDTSTFPTNGGVIQIESEQILYQRATDSTVVNCTRGYNSTSAVAHAQNKTVTVVSQTASNGTSNFDLSGTGAPTSTTGINQAFTGCRYTDLAAGNIYVNQGTLTVPNWILVEAGMSGGITQLTGDVTAGPGSGSEVATLGTITHAVTIAPVAAPALLTLDGSAGSSYAEVFLIAGAGATESFSFRDHTNSTELAILQVTESSGVLTLQTETGGTLVVQTVAGGELDIQTLAGGNIKLITSGSSSDTIQLTTSSGNGGILIQDNGSEGQVAVGTSAPNASASLDMQTTALGFLPLNSHPLTSVVDPTNPQDGATKNYVDIRTTPNLQIFTDNAEDDTQATTPSPTALTVTITPSSISAVIRINLSALMQLNTIGFPGGNGNILLFKDGVVFGHPIAAILDGTGAGTQNLYDMIGVTVYDTPGDVLPHTYDIRMLVGHASAETISLGGALLTSTTVRTFSAQEVH